MMVRSPAGNLLLLGFVVWAAATGALRIANAAFFGEGFLA
jgi:hypothetical protein